ncbi:MAG: type II toxin-antitoxin system VapC family toxin [Actinomycetota bacterium]
MTVLDASALLAYLRDEPGSVLVEEALAAEASIGAVNLAEVLSKLVDADQDPDEAMARIGILPLEVVPFDKTLAVETARLRPATARAGLSLGDRACLALAHSRTRRVLTADGAWRDLIPSLDVVLIR